MRIRWLEFVGFGPYRDRQVIDFDQLGESGLYLINGPTGAGKSTIIDAICYALYGRLAGDDADASRMRSDFCAPNEKHPGRRDLPGGRGHFSSRTLTGVHPTQTPGWG